MASIFPTCPRCGSHNVTMTHFDHHTKARTYQCNACYKRFTQQFESAVYTAPTGKPADNGKPELCNERTELHDFWDGIDLMDTCEDYDQMAQDYRDEYYG